MLCNRSIASAHVANLAFAKVFEHAVGPITVCISMFKPLFACDDNHECCEGVICLSQVQIGSGKRTRAPPVQG
jgi:hypothetical protein